VLATVSFLLVGLLSQEQLLSWGWRVPFLAGFLLIGVSRYVPTYGCAWRSRRCSGGPPRSSAS
jgi:hypothetical protein